MTPKYIMIHHSAVSYKKNSDQFDANNEYHRKTNKQYEKTWKYYKSSLGYYLGYNYEISKLGKIRQARKDGEETAACYQKNMNNGQCIHICIDGRFDPFYDKEMFPNQVFALRDLLRILVKKYNLTKDSIVFHREYAIKSCPGLNVSKKFIQSLIG